MNHEPNYEWPMTATFIVAVICVVALISAVYFHQIRYDEQMINQGKIQLRCHDNGGEMIELKTKTVCGKLELK